MDLHSQIFTGTGIRWCGAFLWLGIAAISYGEEGTTALPVGEMAPKISGSGGDGGGISEEERKFNSTGVSLRTGEVVQLANGEVRGVPAKIFEEALDYYLGRNGQKRNLGEAVKLFRASAKQGCRDAQSVLGTLYATGEGVAQSLAEAVIWDLLAANQGVATSQFNLGLYYQNGTGVAQDYDVAARFYRMAAEQGNAGAQCNLGNLYSDGKGVPQNNAEAIRWYRLAAEQNFAAAQYNLGLRYDNGQGVSQNYAEAVRWYRMAAEQGIAAAQFNLGVRHDNGQGVPQNFSEAARCYRLAALQGHVGAQSNLGILFANGTGVPQDALEAMHWYRLAAAQGAPEAMYNLGERHRVGDGIEQSYVEAYAYYNLAAAAGYEKAREMRDALRITFLKGEALILAQQRSKELRVELDAEKACATNPGIAIGDCSDSAASQSRLASPPKASGSGFIVATAGLVVSNHHVVDGARRIELVTARGTIPARVVLSDRGSDLAILRANQPLPSALPLLSSRNAKLGTEVFTIGFPNPGLQGFQPKYNRGEISSLAGPADDPRYFQISVPVQPGNSGGALCNAQAGVVGIVSAKLDANAALASSGSLPENVNYAIKSSYLLALLESLDLPPGALAEEPKKNLSPEEARQLAQDATVLVLVY